MAKNKYDSHVLPNLEKIEQWAAAGATAKEIAKQLHIAYSTFRQYLDAGAAGEERYSALSAAFTRACARSDETVETALFKRACGYTVQEPMVEERTDKNGDVCRVVKTVTRDIPPDPTSAMFWLTNRRPEKWKYKPDGQDGTEKAAGGVVLIPLVEKIEPPGEQDAEQRGGTAQGAGEHG